MITPTLKIPYVNLAAQHAPIRAELLEAVAGVIDRGDFVLGAAVHDFESRLGELVDARFAVGVNSGTDALVLALRALGVGAGDEVITVPNSFVASTSCIMLVGARPVFVDVRDDYNMDPDQLERVLTPRTKAILPVHLTGRPADMAPIMDFARRHRLSVIEDCAQAVLAEYRGRPVGSMGTVGCFSLHPLKTLNACGDGGVLTTNDESVAEHLKILRNIGLQNRNDCVMWSGNSRLDTLQAAILLVKLKYVGAWTEKRRANAAFYDGALGGIEGVQTPVNRPNVKAVYHTYVIQADRRDELKRYLADHGVETGIHYPIPVHLQTVGQQLGYAAGAFPTAERQAKRILSLPVYPELERSELEYVAGTVRRFYGADGAPR